MKNKKIYFRSADEGDIKDLYKWKNDKTTRKFSLNTRKVTFKEHVSWFNESLSNPKRKIFIIIDHTGKKIGQIRFDKKSRSAEISIAIAPNYRHLGYGTLAIKKGCRLYFNNFGGSVVTSKIKKENTASIKAFKKAGFKIFKKCGDYIELSVRKMDSSKFRKRAL